ncbi:MAG TPA: DUF58 domain-containing protein [Planctomycetota bacterium]|nr:DUF58 domain-containing protein [Planctomycetota bacterium]
MKKSTLLDASLIAQLDHLELVVRRLFSGRTQGEKRSKRRGTGSEFADYRDYSQGDDLRHIDWNVYGRLDRLFLKLFHVEEDLRLSIFVDSSLSMSHGDPSKLLYAKRLAAAMAYIALANLDRVTIEAANGSGFERLPPTRGKQQVWRLLEFVDAIEAQGTTDLHEGLKQFSLRNDTPGMKVVISDFLDKKGYPGALKWLLKGGNEVVVVQVLSPQEVKPPIVGDLSLEDCEDGQLTEVSITAGLLKRYEANLKGLVGGLREYCRTRGLANFFVQSSHPIEQVILNSMRRTGVVR